MTATDEPARRRGRPPSGGREAILDAALTVLRELGIANLTSREVAARAGVSDASVYYHFGDRAGLLQAAFRHSMKPLRFMTGLEQEDLDPIDAIKAASEALDQFFDNMLPVLHAAQADPELRAALAAYIEANDLGPQKGVQLLGAYLRAAQADGRVAASADPDAIALLVIDEAMGRVVRRQLYMHREEQLPSRDALLGQIGRLLS